MTPPPATAAIAPVSGWADHVEIGIKDLDRGVMRGVKALLAVFLLWAFLLPLGTAVVAPGTLVSQGHNKVLQHRTGGVIRKIHVREGERVNPGTLVAELDPMINQAEMTRLRARRDVLNALKARLEAENRFSDRLEQAPGTGLRLSRADNVVASSSADNAVMQEQGREFERGRQAILYEVEALEKRVDGLMQQQRGARGRAQQARQQVAILERQDAAARSLVSGGHMSRQQQWDIENRLLDRRAELASVTAQDQSLTSQIAEVRSQIRQTKMRDGRQTSEKLTEVLGELEQNLDQLRAAEAEVANTELRANVAGTLVHAAIFSVGGVLKAGETFAEIVPEGVALDAQARVSPKDIGSVTLGQQASIRISALNQRVFDKLPAIVSYVAADATTDQRTGERYFEVRVRLAPEVQRQLGRITLSAGMNGEVFIQGAPRTFAAYLGEPLFDSFRRAFGERP